MEGAFDQSNSQNDNNTNQSESDQIAFSNLNNPFDNCDNEDRRRDTNGNERVSRNEDQHQEGHDGYRYNENETKEISADNYSSDDNYQVNDSRSKTRSRSRSKTKRYSRSRSRSDSRSRRRRRSRSRSRSPYSGPIIKDFRRGRRGFARGFHRGGFRGNQRPFRRNFPFNQYGGHRRRDLSRSRSRSYSPKRKFSKSPNDENKERYEGIRQGDDKNDALKPSDIKMMHKTSNQSFLAMLEEKHNKAKMIPIDIKPFKVREDDENKSHGFINTFNTVGDSERKHNLSYDLEKEGWEVIDDATNENQGKQSDSYRKNKTKDSDEESSKSSDEDQKKKKKRKSKKSRKKKKKKRTSSSDSSDSESEEEKDESESNKKKTKKKKKSKRKRKPSASSSDEEKKDEKSKKKKKRKKSESCSESDIKKSEIEATSSKANDSLLISEENKTEEVKTDENEGKEVKKKDKKKKKKKRKGSSSESDSGEEEKKKKKRKSKKKRSKKRKQEASSSESDDSSDSSSSKKKKKKKRKSKKEKKSKKNKKDKKEQKHKISEDKKKPKEEIEKDEFIIVNSIGDPPLELKWPKKLINFTNAHPSLQYSINPKVQINQEDFQSKEENLKIFYERIQRYKRNFSSQEEQNYSNYYQNENYESGNLASEYERFMDELNPCFMNPEGRQDNIDLEVKLREKLIRQMEYNQKDNIVKQEQFELTPSEIRAMEKMKKQRYKNEEYDSYKMHGYDSASASSYYSIKKQPKTPEQEYPSEEADYKHDSERYIKSEEISISFSERQKGENIIHQDIRNDDNDKKKTAKELLERVKQKKSEKRDDEGEKHYKYDKKSHHIGKLKKPLKKSYLNKSDGSLITANADSTQNINYVSKPMTLDMNYDYNWYYQYYLSHYNLDQYSASAASAAAAYYAHYSMLTSIDYQKSDFDKWITQKGYIQHPIEENSKNLSIINNNLVTINASEKAQEQASQNEENILNIKVEPNDNSIDNDANTSDKVNTVSFV